MISLRGRALSGALALIAASGAWMVAGASPAGAYVCAFTITSPTAGSISGSSSVPFRGTFEAKHGLAERVIEVSFTAAPGPLPPPTVIRRSALDLGSTYDVPVGPLVRNGTYTARVRAVHTGTSPLLNCDDGLGPDRRATEASGVVQFKVSVQASPPRNVRARFDAGSRTATVTWERSGDPDIAGYTIIKKVGSAPATGVPVGAEPLSWTDTNLPSGEATITYSVQASRHGPDAGTTSLPSAPVAAAPLVVPAVAGPAPAPSPSTTTGGTGDPATPAGGATSTTAPFALGPAVGGDTPGFRDVPFLHSRGLGFPESPSTAVPDGEGGYQPLIPYPQGGGAGDQQIDADDQAIAGRGSSGGEPGDGTPGLAWVASGLLSSVVAAHVLWLRRQALRPELAGAGSHPELETVSPPDPGPSPSAPVPPVDEASPFEPVPDEAPVDEPQDAEAAVPRQPRRAVREPAAAAAVAGAGAILRPARGGSGSFEPVTPLPPSKGTPPTARPIVVAVAPAERAVTRTAHVGAADEVNPRPDAGIAPEGLPAPDLSPRSRPRSRRLREEARGSTPMATGPNEEVAAASVGSAFTETGEPSPASPEPAHVGAPDAPVDALAEPAASSIGEEAPAGLPVVAPIPDGEAEDNGVPPPPPSSDGQPLGDLPVVAPLSEGQADDGRVPPPPSSSDDQQPAGTEAPGRISEPVAAGAPVEADAPPPIAALPVEPAGPERSAPPVTDADLQPASPQAAAVATADRPERPRRGLRARLGRSRHGSTAWVAAEPVEPAAPTELEADDAAAVAGTNEDRTEPDGAELATAGRPMIILRPKGPSS